MRLVIWRSGHSERGKEKATVRQRRYDMFHSDYPSPILIRVFRVVLLPPSLFLYMYRHVHFLPLLKAGTLGRSLTVSTSCPASYLLPLCCFVFQYKLSVTCLSV